MTFALSELGVVIVATVSGAVTDEVNVFFPLDASLAIKMRTISKEAGVDIVVRWAVLPAQTTPLVVIAL